MTLMTLARGLTAALGGCVVASGLVAATSAAPEVSAAQPTSAASSQVPAGGMYGEVAGGAVRTVPQAVTEPARAPAAADGGGYQNWQDGGTVCGVYANSAGMGSYCSSGGGVDLQPLVVRFPKLWAEFENCRFEDPPPGVDAPTNPSPMEKKWQLRTCLTAINWFSWNGGNDRRVIMDLVLVDKDMDTTYHETRLSKFLWDTMQTMYPVPLLRVQPKTYPVVGQRAYFTFAWMNTKKQEPEQQGPYADDPDGGPYVEHHNGSITMRARATKLTIDPQIKGVKPFDCTVSKLGYVKDAGPDPDDQRSDCHYIFERSSAAAPSISTAEAHLSGDTNVFRLQIDITWRVMYGRQGGMDSLGEYHMLVYQDLPVLDVQAMNEPLPDLDIG